MKYLEENRKVWDERSENNDTWSIPVTSDWMITIAAHIMSHPMLSQEHIMKVDFNVLS